MASAGEPHLCPLCQTLFEDRSLEAFLTVPLDVFYKEQPTYIKDWYFRSRPFHKSLQSLQLSKQLGCFTCSRLQYQGPPNFKRIDVRLEMYFPEEEDEHDDCARIIVAFDFILKIPGEKEFGTNSTRLELLKVDESHQLATLSANARAQTSTGSPEGAALASAWLRACLDNHPSCAKNALPSRYPSKLLDLDGNQVRLLCTRDVHLSAPYATLSHCWGDLAELIQNRPEQVFLLCDETAGVLEAGLHVSRLSKTLRDAVKTVQRLGLHLLWVDCLCIKQKGSGAEEDKLKEIATMDLVYANAMINLGATAASGPSDGCFYERDPAFIAPLNIRWRPTVLHEDAVFQIPASMSNSAPQFIDDSPLFKRAWVLQERLLSTRMLHFAAQQMYWECKETMMASEIRPYGLSNGESSNWLLFPFGSSDRANVVLGSSCREPQWDHWGDLLMHYTSMDLSRPDDDIFHALSALTRRVAAWTNDIFIAGLRRNTFIRDLSWRSSPSAKRSRQWRAPSWSWASVDGKIDLSPGHGAVLVPAAVCVETSVAHVDPQNEFGALKSAYVILEGWLLDAAITYDPSRLSHIATSGDETIEVSFDDEDEICQDVVLILIEYDEEAKRNKNPSEISCLALQRTDEGAYRRIGLAVDYSFDENALRLFRRFAAQDVRRIKVV